MHHFHSLAGSPSLLYSSPLRPGPASARALRSSDKKTPRPSVCHSGEDITSRRDATRRDNPTIRHVGALIKTSLQIWHFGAASERVGAWHDRPSSQPSRYLVDLQHCRQRPPPNQLLKFAVLSCSSHRRSRKLRYNTRAGVSTHASAANSVRRRRVTSVRPYRVAGRPATPSPAPARDWLARGRWAWSGGGHLSRSARGRRLSVYPADID